MPEATDSELRHAIASLYAALDLPRQQLFLAEAGYWLSLSARETFHPSTEHVDDPPRLRAFSEAHHRIFAQLRAMMSASDQRYPDDVFANILVDQVASVGLGPTELLKRLAAIQPGKPA